jgi:DNA polymerase
MSHLSISTALNGDKRFLPVLQWTTADILSSSSIQDLKTKLDLGCHRCKLGRNKNINGPVFYRGNSSSKYILVGEAPGKDEDINRIPFDGKAGKLLDKIWESVSMKTSDWYITNAVKCRPLAPKGSGRENLTPVRENIEACHPYIQMELQILQPHLVVLTGLSAANAILGDFAKKKTMMELGGLFIQRPEYPNITFCCIYHPAALLHTPGDNEKSKFLRQRMWLHARLIKNFIDKLEGNAVTFEALESW